MSGGREKFTLGTSAQACITVWSRSLAWSIFSLGAVLAEAAFTLMSLKSSRMGSYSTNLEKLCLILSAHSGSLWPNSWRILPKTEVRYLS